MHGQQNIFKKLPIIHSTPVTATAYVYWVTVSDSDFSDRCNQYRTSTAETYGKEHQELAAHVACTYPILSHSIPEIKYQRHLKPLDWGRIHTTSQLMQHRNLVHESTGTHSQYITLRLSVECSPPRKVRIPQRFRFRGMSKAQNVLLLSVSMKYATGTDFWNSTGVNPKRQYIKQKTRPYFITRGRSGSNDQTVINHTFCRLFTSSVPLDTLLTLNLLKRSWWNGCFQK